jgi:hypothetical protein
VCGIQAAHACPPGKPAGEASGEKSDDGGGAILVVEGSMVGLCQPSLA